ncbi:MAG: helix-turn-helix domain-containing protein [Pseudonocardia sp.]
MTSTAHAPTELLREWMSAVGDVVRAVNDAEPLETLLCRIAEHTCRLAGFDLCAVMLPDPSGRWLLARGWHGLSPDYVAAVNREHAIVIDADEQDEDTVAARAFREGITLAVPDLAGAARYGQTRRWALRQGFAALLAAPLAGTAGPAGVIVAYSQVRREFSASEIEMVDLLARQALLALETAQLRELQQRTIAELEAKRAQQEWAEAEHRRLMQLLLDEAGLQRLAESLAGSLQASLTIEDVDGTVLASAPDGATPPPGPAARRRRPISDALRSLRERYEMVPVTGRDGRHAWVAPVVIGGQLVGRLWGTGLSAQPEPAQRRLVERFALVVAVELLKRRYLIDTENRLAGDLVEELLRTGTSHIPAATLERAAALGHDLAGAQALAVISVAGGPEPEKLADHVRHHETTSPRPLVGAHEGALVVVLPVTPDPVPVLARVHERVAAAAPGARVATVLGPPVTGTYATAFSVGVAAAALCPAGGTGGVLDLRRLGLAAYLLRSGATGELTEFVDALLGPLEAHDTRRGSRLCTTLRAWLDAGCSVPAAAATLTVHPNTVAYRLGRAEAIVGRDLRSTEVRMELQLAFTVRDVQNLATRTPAG